MKTSFLGAEAAKKALMLSLTHPDNLSPPPKICKHAFVPPAAYAARRMKKEYPKKRVRTTEGPFSACFVSIWAAYRRRLLSFQISVGTPLKTGKSLAWSHQFRQQVLWMLF